MSTSTSLTGTPAPVSEISAEKTAFRILAAISFCHFLNDMMQSVIPAVYPILKTSYHLDFGQIGLITLTLQLTASLLQPLVGIYTDPSRPPIRCRWAWDSRWSGWCCFPRRRAFPAILLAVGWWASDVGVSSGIVARGADGVGRPARAGAIAVSGGRKRRDIAGAAAGRLRRAAARDSAASPGFRPRRWWRSWCLTRVGAWYKPATIAWARRSRVTGG